MANVDLHSLKTLSLCSGAGGLDRGLHLAVPIARTVCYVEIEAYACEVLASRMEEGKLDDAPVWTDLKTFNSERWRGVVDCIIGGYPCQPFSVAGKQLGTADPRHLWPFIREHVDVIKPSLCFFENVSGHLRLGYREVHDDLRSMGYTVAAGLFTAAEVGAPHKRERLFILAANADCPRLEVCDQQSGILPEAHCAGTVWNGHTARGGSQPFEVWGWEAEAVFQRMDDGMGTWMDRLRLCGNGVVPQQAALAFRTLYQSLPIGASA